MLQILAELFCVPVHSKNPPRFDDDEHPAQRKKSDRRDEQRVRGSTGLGHRMDNLGDRVDASDLRNNAGKR